MKLLFFKLQVVNYYSIILVLFFLFFFIMHLLQFMYLLYSLITGTKNNMTILSLHF